MKVYKKIQLASEQYRAGNLRQAAQNFRKVLKADPRNFEAYFYLGNIFQDTQKPDEAVKCYQKGIEINPGFPGTYYNIASILHEKGIYDEAILWYRKVMELDPTGPDPCNAVGVIYESQGQLDEAFAYYREALRRDQKFFLAHNNLGSVLLKKGQIEDAIASYQKAIDLNPNYARAYCGMGIAAQENDRLDEAVEYYKKAIELDPGLAEASGNLGRAFQAKGQLDQAEAYYRQAIRLKPDDPIAYQNLNAMMLYSEHFDEQAVFSGHLKFARQFEDPLLSGIAVHTNEKTAGRRLRIGYMSPDFRRHSVNYFLEPVLAGHDHEGFEIFCYSDVHIPDSVTERLQGYADQWRNITNVPDEKVSEQVRADGIDILVDLAGHTGQNRMLLFARKPAPVQVSWLGYPATTGLKTIDYRIVDGYTDPAGVTDRFHTEELVRMPACFVCYQPDTESPDVGPLPALAAGHVTFGSFNKFSKITPEFASLWAGILEDTAGSRLIIKAKSLADRSTREYAMKMFTEKNISDDRIELLSWVPSPKGHLDIYNRVDIGLDTFPYNGTTTTCEALWMGVPVITLEGKTHASRVGTSLLSAVGLRECIAGNHDEYRETAARLASDLHTLRSIREGLRIRVESSPLYDKKGFVNNLEHVYRTIWEKWRMNGQGGSGLNI